MIDELLGTTLYEGQGIIKLSDSTNVNVYYRITHPKFGTNTATTQLKFLNENYHKDYNKLTHSFMRNGILISRSRTEDFDVRLFDITGTIKTQESVTISHRSYDIGLTDKFQFHSNEHLIQITLSKICIRGLWNSRVQSYDGTIYFDEDLKQNKKAISWESKIGKAELYYNYHYENDLKVESNDCTVQVELPTINYTLNQSFKDIKLIFDEVEKELETLLLLLSLFSRVQVRARKIKLFGTANYGPFFISPKREMLPIEDSPDMESSIAIEDLNEFNIGNMISTLNDHPHKEEIVRALQFLISSYKQSYFESSYFMVHAALESICKALTKGSKKRMRDYERVELIVNKFKINAESFWSETGLNKGLKHAFALRNDLFHEAKTSNVELLYKNTLRFQHILELIIFNVLKIEKANAKHFPLWHLK